jgi:hypothetical protein
MPRAFPLFGAVCIFLGLSVRGESSKDGQTPLAWDVPSLQNPKRTCRPTSNLFGDATTLVTGYRWQAFNAAFCLALDHAESVIVT